MHGDIIEVRNPSFQGRAPKQQQSWRGDKNITNHEGWFQGRSEFLKLKLNGVHNELNSMIALFTLKYIPSERRTSLSHFDMINEKGIRDGTQMSHFLSLHLPLRSFLLCTVEWGEKVCKEVVLASVRGLCWCWVCWRLLPSVVPRFPWTLPFRGPG